MWQSKFFNRTKPFLHHVCILASSLAICGCSDGPVAPAEIGPHFIIAATIFGDNLLHLIDEKGAEKATVTCGQNCSFFHPEWSPVEHVAVIGVDLKTHYSILYVAKYDGTDLREIDRTAPLAEAGSQGQIRQIPNYYDQTWSNDGRLAYVKRDTIFQLTSLAGGPTIVIEGLATHGISWLPGEKAISFPLGSSIKKVFVRGGDTATVASFQGTVLSHEWAPDGSALAVTVQLADSVALVKVDVKSGAVTPIAKAYQISSPCWSQDGTSIAYVTIERSRVEHLYVVDTAGPPREIGTNFGVVDAALWDDTGRWVVTLAPRGFAVNDATTGTSSVIPAPGDVHGYALSTGHCGKMFYLLPDGL
jgi:hypothetical protein